MKICAQYSLRGKATFAFHPPKSILMLMWDPSRISTEWFDAEKVIDLKLSKAEMVFAPESIHSKTKVTYEFHCTHKGKHRYDLILFVIFVLPSANDSWTALWRLTE